MAEIASLNLTLVFSKLVQNDSQDKDVLSESVIAQFIDIAKELAGEGVLIEASVLKEDGSRQNFVRD